MGMYRAPEPIHSHIDPGENMLAILLLPRRSCIGPSISFFLSFVLCNIKLSNLCNYYFFYLKLKIKSMSMSMSTDASDLAVKF